MKCEHVRCYVPTANQNRIENINENKFSYIYYDCLKHSIYIFRKERTRN